MQPIRLEIFLDDKTLSGMRSVEGNAAVMEQELKATISRLENDLADMQTKMKQAMSQGVTSDKELADIQALKGAVGELKEGLKALQKAKQQTNETPVMSDDPAPKLNNVKMSMQQIARELPSLAMGPQMFFLAISNNIPMFTDAVGSARKEYERLTAAGQKATPVWKQLLKSLFSWQTAMAAAITLTVVYGKEIGEWFSSFSGGRKSIDIATESLKGFQKAMAEGEKNAQKEQTHLNLLYNAAVNSAKGTNERKRAVLELKKEYPDYFGQLNEETILLGRAKTAYDKLSASILATSKARAAESAIVENDKKILELDDKRIGFLVKQTQAQGRLDKEEALLNNLKGNPEGYDFQLKIVESVREEVKEYGDQVDETVRSIELLNKTNERLAGKINIEDLLNDNKNKNNKPKADKRNYTDELADARIRAQQKIESARIAIMVEGRDKRKAIAQKEYNDTIAAINKEERDTLSKLEKSKKAGNKVTPEEIQQVKDDAMQQRRYAGIQHLQDNLSIEKEWREKNQQAWIDYNKEYGSYQEKRLAIAQDYALKIGKAETEGEKETLKRKREEDFRELDFSELNNSVNLADVFGNLDAQSTEALSKMRDKLKEIIEKSAKDLKPTDLKALQDAFKEIDLKVADRNPFGELKQSIDDYKASTQAVIKAQEDLNTVQQGGEVIIGTYIDSTGKICKKLLDQEQAEKNVTSAQNNRKEAQTKLNKSINSVGEKGQQLVQAGNDMVDMLTSLGVSIPDSVKGALDGVGQVMDSLANIDLTKPMSIVTGITGTLAGIGKTIGSIFGLGNNDSVARYEALKEQLSSINEIYEKIIASSKEKIVFGGGFASIQAANDALDTYYKKVENYRRLADAAGGAGSGWFKHSYAARTNENLSGDWKNISQLVGKNISGIQDMYNLTGDQLDLIRTKMPEAWNKIQGHIKENLDAIADCKDEAHELADALNAAMTGIDTDSFYNGFIDQLSDMDTSFEDMCDNFEGYLRKSILAGLVASQYSDRIKGLYEDWSKYAQSDKKITEEEAKDLQDRYKSLVEDMTNDREEMAKVYGWSTSGKEGSTQSGRSGSFTTISQEQGTKLEGLFTSLQDHTSAMRKLLEDLMKGRNADHELFAQIAENTAYCRYLELMYEILEEVKRDGWKMKG